VPWKQNKNVQSMEEQKTALLFHETYQSFKCIFIATKKESKAFQNFLEETNEREAPGRLGNRYLHVTWETRLTDVPEKQVGT